jgi:NAD(P)-dependent dehydrogenase (short-subunit alcohol dehydrogenase family)
MGWTLVTGGAKRLGAELARTLAEQGYSIAVHYNRSPDDAEKVAQECRKRGVQAQIIQGDFQSVESTEDFLQRYLQQFPITHHLINNVGNFLIKSPLETSIEEWLSIFQNNLHVPFMLSKALAPSLKKIKGAIVNIGMAGVNGGRADTYCTAYHCAKTSLNSLTKSLAKELASDGVRVNMISPGYLENAVDLPSNWTKLPMQRPAALSEVACAVAYLLGTEGRYITGQNIEIAGGVRL